jgi:hypothetical protein
MILENQEFDPQDPLNEAFIQEEDAISSPHISIQILLDTPYHTIVPIAPIVSIDPFILDNTVDSTGMI